MHSVARYFNMSKPFKILSIDGGGVRGILSGHLLVALEQKLQQKSGNPEARIADYFDMIAGNSTGGILTCLYLMPDANKRPLFTAEQAVNLYFKYGQDIFEDAVRYKILTSGGLSNTMYPVVLLEKLLEKYFQDKKLSDLLRPCIIPSYNIESRSTHFFTQQDAKQSPEYDYFLKHVARATSAAPSYFPPAKINSMANQTYTLVDGGVFANNPAMCAYAEVVEKYGVTAKNIFMVSLSTGSEKRSLAYDEAKGWGALGWIFPVLDIVMSGANDTVDYQLKQLFKSENNAQGYIRIDPKLGEAKPEMDNASADNLEALKQAGLDNAVLNYEQLEIVANYLIASGIVKPL